MTQKELANLIHETLAEMLTEYKTLHNDEYRKNFYREGMFESKKEEIYVECFHKSMVKDWIEGKLVMVDPVYRLYVWVRKEVKR